MGTPLAYPRTSKRGLWSWHALGSQGFSSPSALIALINQTAARARGTVGRGQFPDLVQSGGAGAIQPRSRDAAFVLLSRDGEGVHRHRRKGTVLRHGLLGHCHQPTPQSARGAVPRGCPQASAGKRSRRRARPHKKPSAKAHGSRRWPPSTRTTPPSRSARAPPITRRRWRGWSARYPDDAEAAIFYALALNEAADPADKTYAKQLKAADILEKLEPKISKSPRHPALHHPQL